MGGHCKFFPPSVASCSFLLLAALCVAPPTAEQTAARSETESLEHTDPRKVHPSTGCHAMKSFAIERFLMEQQCWRGRVAPSSTHLLWRLSMTHKHAAENYHLKFHSCPCSVKEENLTHRTLLYTLMHIKTANMQ